MVELLLPKHSKPIKGKTFKPEGEHNNYLKPIEIYRWDRSNNENPRIDTFWVDYRNAGPMILDSLNYIKSELDTLLKTFNWF